MRQVRANILSNLGKQMTKKKIDKQYTLFRLMCTAKHDTIVIGLAGASVQQNHHESSMELLQL